MATPETEHCLLTVYQTRLVGFEADEAEEVLIHGEQQPALGRQEIARGEEQLAPARATYEEGKAIYDQNMPILESKRSRYESYLRLVNTPFATQEVRGFIAEFERGKSQ